MSAAKKLVRLLKQPATLVMGVLNVTPDSFSDGGIFLDFNDAIAHAEKMFAAGAHIVDVGGQSTAPGSDALTYEEELRRIAPVVERLTADGHLISVDTFRSEVAKWVLRKDVAMINDVTALRGDPEMASVLADNDSIVTLMYAKDADGNTTRVAKKYGDVVAHIASFFQERIDFAVSKGIERERLVLDPGMGAFVSSEAAPSLEILHRLGELTSFNVPLLVGASRKGFIGEVLGLGLDERLEGSLACAVVATCNGAKLVRVHDVQETVRVVKMADAVAGKT